MADRVSIPNVRVKSVRTRAYFEAASGGRRAKGWANAAPPSPATMLSGVRPLSVRARYASRNDPRAAAAVEVLVSNIVGTGIKPQPRAENARFKAAASELWEAWTDEADVAGLLDFYGLQSLIARTVVEAGECFVRFRPRPLEAGLSVPLQIEIVDPELCPVDLNRELGRGARIRAGVEFNSVGERVAFHFYAKRPGDGLPGGYETVRVSASEVLHVFRPLVPGQVRGVSWLAPVLVRLSELDQYDDAELVRKKTAAMFTAFIEHGQEYSGDPFLPVDANGGLEMAPGGVVDLAPGESIKFSNPVEVGGSYDAFLRAQMRAIAAGLGVEYHHVSGDLTQVNYSSIRAGLIEFRRRVEAHQHHLLVFQFCRPIWRRWVELAVLSGALKAPGYSRNPGRFLAAKWLPQAFEWVDPAKDLRGKIEAIRAGLVSRSEVIAGLGYDAEIVDAELAADQSRADRLALTLSTDARRPNDSSTSNNEEGAANADGDE